MADVKDLDFTLSFADLVIDQKRAVKQLPDRGSFSNRATHTGKPGEQLDMGD